MSIHVTIRSHRERYQRFLKLNSTVNGLNHPRLRVHERLVGVRQRRVDDARVDTRASPDFTRWLKILELVRGAGTTARLGSARLGSKPSW